MGVKAPGFSNPGDKDHMEGGNILTPITQILNEKLNFELNLKYQTIYGTYKKKCKVSI